MQPDAKHPPPRYEHAANLVGHSLYIIGGNCGKLTTVAAVPTHMHAALFDECSHECVTPNQKHWCYEYTCNKRYWNKSICQKLITQKLELWLSNIIL